MTITIISRDKDLKPWVVALKEADSSLDVQVWPHEKQKADIKFALCWKHPEGVLQDYPNLQCVSSMGAGVDHLLNDAFLPKHLPVVRIVDPLLAQYMFEYLCTAVMYYFREFDVYQAQQAQSQWYQHSPKSMNQTTIGIMGLGKIGGYSAEKLSKMGFNVIGWSRSPKSIANVKAYVGDNQLGQFLAHTNILICLLPLTDRTSGILNLKLFHQLPQGSYLINVARGEHLVEEDLITALNQGQLRGACLDVFQQEPLPIDHPFWMHKQIIVTPHCSSITDPRSVAPQIVQNYRRMQRGEPLLNQVSVLQGY